MRLLIDPDECLAIKRVILPIPDKYLPEVGDEYPLPFTLSFDKTALIESIPVFDK